MGLPTRLKTAKAPRSTVEKKKHHFKPSVIAKRRKAFYTTGKGSTGVLVRHPRLVRYIRKIRKEQNKRYEQLTGGAVEEGKKIVLFHSFPDTLVGAIDAYANRIMELAADHAKGRRSQKGKPPKVGMKLRKDDLIFAIRWITKLANE